MFASNEVSFTLQRKRTTVRNTEPQRKEQLSWIPASIAHPDQNLRPYPSDRIRPPRRRGVAFNRYGEMFRHISRFGVSHGSRI